MRIILRVYKEIAMGNLSTMIIDIPHNKITVFDLKEKIHQKYKINPDKQKLTFRFCHKKLITLTDSFPLNYFFIKNYSMIFLEIISHEPQPKPEEIKKFERKNSAMYKYMNMLGYYLPDSRTFQRTGIGDRFRNDKNSFYEDESGNNSNFYEYEESESDSTIIVNDGNVINENSDENKNETKSGNIFTKKKSNDYIGNIFKNGNSLLKKGLAPDLNLVEKLCIYTRKNNLEKVKWILSQYNNNNNNINNFPSNNDFNDSSEFNNNSAKNIQKVSSNYRYNQKRISQARTNNKTCSSFNSGNSLSLVNNSNICEILNKFGWNALHYAAYLGLDEILDYILKKNSKILNTNININITNNEGWSPLLLAVFKQNIKCVELFVSLDNIDVNYLGDMGTALHLACKKNNRQIVSKLILKADPTIKDKNNKIALEYTNDKVIIKLISKTIFKKLESTDKNIPLYKELEDFTKEYKHLFIYKKTKGNNNINQLNNQINKIISSNEERAPKKPPFFFGELEQSGGFLSLKKKKYIEINPLNGVLRIFKLFEDYPQNPSQSINLIDIISCEKDEEKNNKKNYSFFIINYYLIKGLNNENEFLNKDNKENTNININHNNNKICSEKYFVHSDKVCNDLVNLINKEINFHKYWNNLIKKNRDKKEGIIKYLSNEKFNTLKYILESEDKSINNNNNYILINDLGKEIPLDESIFQLDNNKEDKDDDKDSIKSNENIDDKEEKKNEEIETKENPDDSVFVKKRSQFVNSEDFDKNTQSKINFNSFELLDELGSGSFGKVFKVKQKNTDKIYAMKVLNKSYLIKNKWLRYAETECKILKQSNCPFIIKLHYSFQTKQNLYMILDFCPYGDLSDQVELYLFEEDEAKFYIAELILAIEYLHKRDIIYRDLKPANILIDEDGHFKLADFGLAKENVNNDIPSKTFCGSKQYLSPEMLSREGTTKAADIYGIGTILFQMVTGDPPFYNEDEDLMYKNISENKLMFPEFFSDELKDILKKMLEKDPKKRIKIPEIKKHIFFEDLDWDLVQNKKIQPPVEMINTREEYNLKVKVNFKDEDYDLNNYDNNRVKGFSFIKKDDKDNNDN